jgi:hypothetical protein
MFVLLVRQDQPRLPWVLVLLGGFAMLCAGLVHMGWKGFGTRGKSKFRQLRVGAILASVGLVAWFAALWNA